MQKKAVILFSGGLDSTTCIAIAKSQGYSCYALSFNYNQKHSSELNAAKKIVQVMEAEEHRIIPLMINGSALINDYLEIPDYQGNKEIPTTYVPARNTIFLANALSWAEEIGAFDIFIGANDIDYSGYPDCRWEYIQAFEKLANLATKAGVEGNKYTIHAPLLRLTKAEIIRWGIELGVDYALTLSCYRADEEGRACNRCDSCTYRRKGFHAAQVADPTRYVSV